MHRAIPLILLLAAPVAACATPDGERAAPSPPRPTPASSTSAPSPTPSAEPTPPRTAVFWDNIPPVSPTSIEFEPEWPPPRPGSTPRDDAISALVDQQPTKYTAVIIDRPGFIVTLPDGKDLVERRKAARATTKAPITFVIVDRSQAEQSRLYEELASSLMRKKTPADRPFVVGIGTDPRGAVGVYFYDKLAEDDTIALRKVLKERYGVGVVFRKIGLAQNLSR